MSDSNRKDPVEKLLQLQQKFKSKLSARISDIESSWLRLRDEETPDFNDLHLMLHSLVGAAGTFGASIVSTYTRKVETQIKLLLNNELILNDAVTEEIDYLITQLHEVAEKWQPSSIPFIPEKKSDVSETVKNWQSKIYLVEDDTEVAIPLIKSLEGAGYKVFYFRDIKEFENKYSDNERASAIIMDMAFKEGHVAGAETIKQLSDQNKYFPPVIFISVHQDVEARLAAAQAGAKRYFTKPLVKYELIATLDKLTNRKKYKPYRVLLIDDEKDVLDYYATCLQNEGMEVLSFTNPLEAYQSIKTFNPELIILDLYMPECSGFDLAKVIRQDDEQAYIPIVFLSSELDVGVQLAAMGLGGDDFLMKPVDTDYFIQAMTARVKRSRRINSLNEKYKDALRESEYRLITLDQHAIISMTDINGIITFANEHFINISGYSEEELIGKNHKILKSGKHPDSFYENMWETISRGEIWRGQVCNKKKNGFDYWVEATIVPFMDEKGLPYKYVSVRTDITEVKQSEENAKEAERRLLEQQQTLNTLTSVTDYVLLEETAFFNIVTQRAADTLNIERVSIWMLDKSHQEIMCRKAYEKSKGEWSSGQILKRENYPKYFSALENNTVISVYDAHTHSATAELSKNYLTPLGIGAILDIPIRRQGHLIGVICCEHIGNKRTWHSDEQGFVSGLSDLISLNLESSERKKVEIKLVEAKKDADDANKAKSEFLSSMSHELRTPMNAISGFAQLLLYDSEQCLNDLQTSNIKEIIKASSHLLELINEILNLAKIESGNIDLTIETVSYSEVILECLSLMETLINDRQIKILYSFNGDAISAADISSTNIFMHVDRMRLKQILLNLLSNAVKYNFEEGSISVMCDVSNSVVRISVVDTGKGISSDGLKELFTSFNRLGEENGSVEGSGIGLVITKKLVELMGGNIGADSKLGVGSTFWVEFPSVSPSNSSVTAENNTTETNTLLENNVKHTVLYIEDNPANLRLVEQILSSRTNVNMISAPEPNLGLELAYTKLPDLILLDLNLPGMSGFEVLKKLKENDDTKNIPVFAVSANAMITDIEKGMDAGFDDYITKPVDVKTFIVSITKILKK